MKDREYSPRTKSMFANLQARLLRQGYKLSSYGDYKEAGHTIGEAYFTKPGTMLKATYFWVKNPAGNGIIADKMRTLEDVSSCYSIIDGKATGYR